eukprot:gene303-317_t
MLFSGSSDNYSYYHTPKRVTSPSRETKERSSSSEPSSNEKEQTKKVLTNEREREKDLKPVSAMSWEIDLDNLKDCENPEKYFEEYRVDVDDDELERILEGADGRIEVHDDIVTRYMPECGGKSEVPMKLSMKWGAFLDPRYKVKSGTHGVRFAGRRTVVAPDMNLFDRQTRRAPPENEEHMMREGYPAQNWCLEVEFENEARQRNKGFDKVNNLFSYRGANNTTIDEIWLLVYPHGNRVLTVPVPPNPLPVAPLSQARPARGSKYFAIFVRNLDAEGDFHHVEDAERPLLVGYYLIEPNMIFQVPACSLLSGAPDILTNELLDAMGYTVQQQQQQA